VWRKEAHKARKVEKETMDHQMEGGQLQALKCSWSKQVGRAVLKTILYGLYPDFKTFITVKELTIFRNWCRPIT
jgi:hypothetical protein